MTIEKEILQIWGVQAPILFKEKNQDTVTGKDVQQFMKDSLKILNRNHPFNDSFQLFVVWGKEMSDAEKDDLLKKLFPLDAIYAKPEFQNNSN